MCLKTRIRHWRQIGLVPLIVTVLYGLLVAALANHNLTTGLSQALYASIPVLLLASLVYAMYGSPAARKVRRAIVANRVTRPRQAGGK